MFGDFNSICLKSSIPLCAVVQSKLSTTLDSPFRVGIIPTCYARAIELSNTMIFQIGNAFANIGCLVVLLLIIYNVRLKFTAIGRSEYLYFFQLAVALIIITLVVDCGVSPPSSGSYPYFVAVQLGLAGACCWTLAIAGFLGFRLWEDGSVKAMFFTRGASFASFALNFLVALFTFKNWSKNGGVSRTETTGLFIVVYILNAICVCSFVVCQFLVSILVVRNLWVTGGITLGVIFFVIGQLFTYQFSAQICSHVKHYLDGLFFGSLCNVFTFMMIYKTWDMTTDDDLEFSVSTKDGEVVYAEIRG